MKTKELLDSFPFFLNAPNGIEKARELILHFAIRGELVPQDKSAVPVKDLSERISLKLDPISEVEYRHPIPSNWIWVRFLATGTHRLGKMLDKAKNRGVEKPYLRNTNVQWGRFETFDIKQMRIAPEEENELRLFDGDLLICEGGEPGRCAVWRNQEKEMYFQKALHRVRAFEGVVPEYLALNLALDARNGVLAESFTGATIKHLTSRSLSNYAIPLPPTEEQGRIVDKVSELMAFCDRLEAQHHKRDRLFPSVSLATHHRFLQRPSRSAVEEIFDECQSISPDEMRETILSLAMSGKLSEQYAFEGSGADLLDKISRSHCYFKKKVESFNNEEQTYSVPGNWTWCRLNQISELITSGSRGWAEYYASSGALFVTMGNLSRGSYKLDFSGRRYVDPPRSQEGARTKLQENDILISITGEVGKLGLVPKGFGEAYINQHVCLLRISSFCNSRFIAEFLLSSHASKQFNEPQRGVKNSFRLTDIAAMSAPLPPRDEQDRIVAKIAELMVIVEQLAEQKRRKRRVAGAFAQAAVTAITGASSQEPAQMNTPKTDLVTRLQVDRKPEHSEKAPLATLLAENDGALSAKALWQRSGLAIDAFYQQLKMEMAQGWIVEPEPAAMREVAAV